MMDHGGDGCGDAEGFICRGGGINNGICICCCARIESECPEDLAARVSVSSSADQDVMICSAKQCRILS